MCRYASIEGGWEGRDCGTAGNDECRVVGPSPGITPVDRAAASNR